MDLQLISGEFFYDDIIPKEKAYLLKYCKNDQHRRFLVYFFEFQDAFERHGAYRFYRNFIDHTGYECCQRVMQKWLRRLRELEKSLAEASKAFDLEEVEKIKTGQYRFEFNW